MKRRRLAGVAAALALALSAGQFALSGPVAAEPAVPSSPAATNAAVTDGYEVANKGALASVDLAGTWTFRPVAPAAAATTIQVPGGGWVKQGFTSTSEAVYERSITIPSTGQPQTVMLELGAVNHEATLKVDGKTVGTRTTSYTPSNFDLTPFVTPGGTHTITLDVKGRDALTKDGKYLVAEGAEWSNTVAQGIYRSAFLRVYPQAYVASTFVRTSVADKTVSYDVEVRNTASTAKTVTLAGALASANGGSFSYPAIPNRSVTVPANSSVTTTIGPLTWSAGADSYWWPNVPYAAGYKAQLHVLTTTLTDGQSAGQTTKTRFGFREFTQPPNQTKYFLNGSAINLRGDNIQVADYDRIDSNGKSDAVDFLPGFLPPSASNPGWPKAVDNYQRLNFNVVRLHQSPVSPYMIDVLDEMGMLAIGESAIRGSANREDFVAGHDNMVDHVRDIVLQNRNHASIIEWSQTNEADQAATDSEQFEKDLFNAIRKVDPTRPIIADGPPPGYYPTMTPENGYTQFNTFEHYIDGFANYGTAMTNSTTTPNGETEYIWPATSTKAGFTWFTTSTVGKRAKGAADLRPYTLLSGWASFVPGTKSTDFVTEENRNPLYGEDNLPDPWANPQIQLAQKGFSPYLAADIAYWDQSGRSNAAGEFPVKSKVQPIGFGQQVSRGITVFNDGLRGTTVDFSWKATAETPNGPVLASGSTPLTIPLAGQTTVPVTFTSPTTGTAVYLSLTTSVGGVEQFTDSSEYLPLGSATSIDDATIGTGDRQVEYTGAWTQGGNKPGFYGGTESTSAVTGAKATTRFTGNLASLSAGKGPDRGIVAISIDGGAETRVDLYSSAAVKSEQIWASPVLASGQHAVTVRVTGEKNAAASGSLGSIDRLQAPTSLTTTVVGEGSGRCLDLYGRDKSDGAKIDIYDCDGGTNQVWTLDADNQLVNGDSGKCLDIAGAGTQNGASVQQWTCNSGANQKWTYDSEKRLVNPISGKCLNVYGGGTVNQSRLVIWTCDSTSQNKWTLAVPAEPTAPGAPQRVTGVAGNGSVTVSWAAPASNGGEEITKYAVSSVPESKGCVTSTGWSTYTCTVPALTNGTAYTFTVTAQNSVGVGAASAPSPAITPVGPTPSPTLSTSATASTRCIAGKVVLTVVTTNQDSVPVTAKTDTLWGSKSNSLAPGKTAASAFTTRATSVVAGTTTTTMSGTKDGHPITATVAAPFAARDCR